MRRTPLAALVITSSAYWMLVSALASALQGACIRGLGSRLDWQTILLVRTAVGLALALIIARSSGTRIPFPGPKHLWIRSGAGAFALLCTFFATTQIPIANVTLLLHSSPIWILLASSVLLGQRLRRSLWLAVWLAVVVGLVGIGLVVRPAVSMGPGEGLAGFAGVLSAISIFAVGRMRHVPALAIVVHANAAALVAAALVTWGQAGGVDTRFYDSRRDLLLLATVAVLGIAAQFSLIRAYTSGSAHRLAPLQYTTIVFAVVADLALFDHIPTPPTVAGMACIVGPLLWIVTRPAEPISVRHGVIGTSNALSDADLSRLEGAIAHGETLTSAEVRIHLERVCHDRVSRPRAVFDELGMAKTRLRNGVLIYIAIESRVIALAIDDGISDTAPKRALDDEVTRLMTRLRDEEVVSVLENGIVSLCAQLGRVFPPQPSDSNELPNTISLGL